jgi:hypothetical protein
VAQFVFVSFAQKASAEFLGAEQIVHAISVFRTGSFEFGQNAVIRIGNEQFQVLEWFGSHVLKPNCIALRQIRYANAMKPDPVFLVQ